MSMFQLLKIDTLEFGQIEYELIFILEIIHSLVKPQFFQTLLLFISLSS